MDGKTINTAQTIRNFFFPTMPAKDVLDELKKLTATDKEELLAGIIKVNGTIFYNK